MLSPTATRSVNVEEYDAFLGLLDGHELPNPALARYIFHGVTHNQFKLTDGSRALTICQIPASVETCDFDSPKSVPTNAVITQIDCPRDEQISWYLPADEVAECDLLPTLRQAYHEGETYRDREAASRYHFDDGETIVADEAPNPVTRLAEPVTITAVEFLGGQFPQEWFLETEDGDVWYLRERSGNIRLYDTVRDTDREHLIFHAFVGGEHPGTKLQPPEVLNMVSAVDYINIVDHPDEEVPETAHEQYWEDFDGILGSTEGIDADEDELFFD